MEAPANTDIISPHRVFERQMDETYCHPFVCSRHHIHTIDIRRQALESFVRLPRYHNILMQGGTGCILALRQNTPISTELMC